MIAVGISELGHRKVVCGLNTGRPDDILGGCQFRGPPGVAVAVLPGANLTTAAIGTYITYQSSPLTKGIARARTDRFRAANAARYTVGVPR